MLAEHPGREDPGGEASSAERTVKVWRGGPDPLATQAVKGPVHHRDLEDAVGMVGVGVALTDEPTLREEGEKWLRAQTTKG